MEMKKLGFGVMRLPLGPSGEEKEPDKEKVRQMIDAFLAAGYTYFDTAFVYHRGSSEKILGELLADRYPRTAYVLTTKMPIWLCKTAEDYEPLFRKQLERTRAGYFDYYFLHSLDDSNIARIEAQDGFGFLRRKKEEDLIRHMGFSFHGTAAALEQLLKAHPETELVQLQINYADWESENVQSRLCYEVCRKAGIPVAVMEPVKGGSLVNPPQEAAELMKRKNPEESFVSWALRFAGSLPGVKVVLSGMSSMEQLEENMKIFDSFRPLEEEERQILEKASTLYQESFAVKCTRCGYCTEGCPRNIPIPVYFNLYNASKRFGYEPAMNNMYASAAVNHGRASDCIACGQCEAHCPQHLPIIEKLAETAALFEG